MISHVKILGHSAMPPNSVAERHALELAIELIIPCMIDTALADPALRKRMTETVANRVEDLNRGRGREVAQGHRGRQGAEDRLDYVSPSGLVVYDLTSSRQKRPSSRIAGFCAPG